MVVRLLIPSRLLHALNRVLLSSEVRVYGLLANARQTGRKETVGRRMLLGAQFPFHRQHAPIFPE